jgi:hypothetical protein
VYRRAKHCARKGAVGSVEKHLLAGEECRERLVGWDAYVGAMRAAMEASDSAMGLRYLRTTFQGVRR